MTPVQGLVRGAVVGVVFFALETLATFIAAGSLFQYSGHAFILLGLVLLTEVTAGAMVGVLWGISRPMRWLSPFVSRVLVNPWGVTLVAAMLFGWGVQERTRSHHAPTISRGDAPVAATPVLMVVVDTLRADALYGDTHDFPDAPNLKKRSQNAVVFTDAEAAAGWTIPSVATLLTGIHPATLYSARGYLPSWAPTLAQHLRAGGYATHAVVDNSVLEYKNGFGAGLETFIQRAGYRFANAYPAFRIWPKSIKEFLREHLRVSYAGATSVTDDALALLAHEDSDAALFYVHYMDVHHPFYPRAGRIDPKECTPLSMHRAVGMARGDAHYRGQKVTDEHVCYLKHRYRGEVNYVDEQLERLLAAFDRKYDGQGLVVLTSDHGEEFMDHGRLGHGQSLYREMVNVPLMVWLPKAQQASVERRALDLPIGLVDVVPTMLDVLGVTPIDSPARIQGQSRRDWWEGTPAAPSALFAEHTRRGNRYHRHRSQNFSNQQVFDHGQLVQDSLFDLSSDPTEQHDVSISMAATKTEMQAQFHRAREQQVAKRDPAPNQSEENLKALEALGYIQ